MQKNIEGKTVAEAVEKACLQFNTSADELDYEVIRQDSKKIFGLLGGKSAIIRVKRREKEGKDIVKDLIDSAFSDLKEEQPKPAADLMQPSVPAAVGTVEAPPDEEWQAESGDQLEIPAAVSEPAMAATQDVAIAINPDGVKQSLIDILALMGLAVGAIEIRFEGRDCHVVVDENNERPVLTSRKGQVLDALQYLLNKLHGVRGGRIYVDSGGFRSRHENNISKLALKLGAKAKKSRKPVTINALNAHDRRLVHLAIQEDKELRSRSKGEGEYKKIIIYPKNGYRRREKSKPEAADN
ncbi:MAG: Jag N-terminal domain-containing protein [Deltaproteobacteria bacterium]|nr:Jag N-terminal domain-containing protein [Candidatus Anaeroferrophillus wilburensis]MBN2889172.1 Jag N-terminal domain-containing protein [Deltaproteobacteria bacterium]